jgi:hypothetical protein
MALKVWPPALIVNDTPPRLVCKGKDSEGLLAGPILVPNTEKKEPWAMEEFGNAIFARLAAFTMPRLYTVGCAVSKVPVNASNERQIICFNVLLLLGSGTAFKRGRSLLTLTSAGNAAEKDQGIRTFLRSVKPSYTGTNAGFLLWISPHAQT